MLLTALLGPLAVGGSLLPVGQKAIFAWLTGFFSVGMIKLCFNIISGLVATMVLNADNNDPMIFEEGNWYTCPHFICSFSSRWW
jgi:hypothetical protein